jgi:three-Cys-motif partner protein
MAKKDRDRHDIDETDGLRRDLVGSWAPEKHLRLQRYVDITRSTRKMFASNAPAYVDLFCATGRSKVRGTTEAFDGSPLVAALEAQKGTPFGHVHIGDLDQVSLGACESRLVAAGVSGVQTHVGAAVDTARRVVDALNPYGLHLAFLDPYSLDALPFEVVRTLAKLKRMDFIIHISEMDFQRNVIGKGEHHKLDAFAPGWRTAIDLTQPNHIVKRDLLAYYRTLLSQLGYKVSDNIERVTGERNQPLYWLVLASRNELADRFWGQVSNVDPQQRMFE